MTKSPLVITLWGVCQRCHHFHTDDRLSSDDTKNPCGTGFVTTVTTVITMLVYMYEEIERYIRSLETSGDTSDSDDRGGGKELVIPSTPLISSLTGRAINPTASVVPPASRPQIRGHCAPHNPLQNNQTRSHHHLSADQKGVYTRALSKPLALWEAFRREAQAVEPCRNRNPRRNGSAECLRSSSRRPRVGGGGRRSKTHPQYLISSSYTAPPFPEVLGLSDPARPLSEKVGRLLKTGGAGLSRSGLGP